MPKVRNRAAGSASGVSFIGDPRARAACGKSEKGRDQFESKASVTQTVIGVQSDMPV
jgi:hypothetical protein